MNTPNNKRRKDSQHRIESAFVKLLQKYEITQIRVTDICKLANVNRTTFYANYADIYALAESVQRHLEEDVFDIINGTATSQEYHFLNFFYHVKENQLLYKTYFKLLTSTPTHTFGYNLHEANIYYNNQYIEYHIAFFANGLTAILKKWLTNNCKETPEEIYSIIQTEYQHRLKHLQ